ncbi:3'-5' exoribonuclease YhaM family protein [Methanosphaera cuniculi]|uniref:3'-5' exoribonuclease YhaM family protein n=1 Tax=Methanosphaera cuniculi TaxID=1077256 RepID=UPI0026E96A41|nr:HD domain-containing protein [Methanosphaera cuniculi]
MKKENDFIKNFNEDREITSQFLLIEKQIRKTKTNKPYLELTIQDKTGNIKARMFDGRPRKIYEKYQVNQVITIKGKVQEYPPESGNFNILIDTIFPSRKYDENDFIQKAENYEKNLKYLQDTLDSIEDTQLTKVVDAFFKDPEFYDKFIQAPAAKIHHHNYQGGLLTHTNEVVKICNALSDIYPELDRQLLVTGALLHDIGKIKTYTYDTNIIDINYEGQMLDHLYIGANMLESKLSNLDIDDKLKVQLIHMILSHHGEKSLGWGSTVDPKIPEAIALHYADDISAKLAKATK